MKILITGLSGFLGSRLEEFWKNAGHTVGGTTRRDPTLFPPHGFDAVVHCAYDRKGGAGRNQSSTETSCAAAELAGVPYQIFVSSYAARPQSQAEYGQMKYQLEKFFLERGHAVVRPGLVIGNGGMFGRNLKTILRSPVIPLLDGGQDLIPVIAVEDFVRAMDLLVQRRSAGAFNLFNPQLVSMRTLVETINRTAGRRSLLVPVPLKLALVLLTVAETLRVPLPSGADNVRSLKQSVPHVYESDLEAIIRHPCSLQAMIESAVRNELPSPR